jgi:hypothetical protein
MKIPFQKNPNENPKLIFPFRNSVSFHSIPKQSIWRMSLFSLEVPTHWLRSHCLDKKRLLAPRQRRLIKTALRVTKPQQIFLELNSLGETTKTPRFQNPACVDVIFLPRTIKAPAMILPADRIQAPKQADH